MARLSRTSAASEEIIIVSDIVASTFGGKHQNMQTVVQAEFTYFETINSHL